MIALSCAASAFAQPGAALADLAQKSTLTAADRETIRQKLRGWIEELKIADSDRERARSRDQITQALAQGTNAFRAAASDVAAGELTALMRSKPVIAHDAVMILGELNQMGTAPALYDALQSRLPAVRYQAASAVKSLQPKMTAPGQYGPAITALAGAAEKETDRIVQRMIYQALDFTQDGSAFAGKDELAKALTRVLAVRLGQSSSAGVFNPNQHVPLYQTVQRLAADLTDAPVRLVAHLAEIMKLFVERARNGAIRRDAVAECESALHALIDKFGGRSADLPRLADLIDR
ncbi:MAG: HEAT repeat domain-containing protein, partial [Phycisphaerae bacterium]